MLDKVVALPVFQMGRVQQPLVYCWSPSQATEMISSLQAWGCKVLKALSLLLKLYNGNPRPTFVGLKVKDDTCLSP
jgi:N6-adenosine-specific RNA methylase IME4